MWIIAFIAELLRDGIKMPWERLGEAVAQVLHT